MQNLSSVNSFSPHWNRDSIKLLKQLHQMTYETLGDFQSIVPLKTFTAVVIWQLRCHMSFAAEWDWNNTAVFLFHSVFPLLLLLSLPSTQLLGYDEEKRQIHRSVGKKNLQVHMDPQGQPIIGYFSCGSLSFSISHPLLRLSWVSLRLGLKYTLCHMLHADTVCQLIAKATERKSRKKGRG